MKKSLLIFSALPVLAFSQNRHINFETGNLTSVFEKAKKENKFILVDAYTTWCGPCKWMSKNIFTNDTAADYY
ncbi:MAG TPA: thioredoxin family protein, partial [Bacteroidia bacterium]|nr:thioredoxin family protein [Bacteroidia bacterium]